MDIKFIRNLASVMQEYKLNKLNYTDGDTKVELETYIGDTKRKIDNSSVNQNNNSKIFNETDIKSDYDNILEKNIDKQSFYQEEGVDKETQNSDYVCNIESNMIGTFYSKPSPQEDAFVQVGRVVDKDEVVCIIESMKLMNEIRAAYKCEILEVLVGDGQVVEFGQALFRVKNLDKK